MKRRNATRNALFTSVLSLLLCVSMLVGTTFAWFTDEVVTGMNTIAAGNLDVELLDKDGNEVKPDTKLFNLTDAQGNKTWWEPGMVVYEKLQVANVGTLALKYQMTLNFGNENDLNGHKLSEVLKAAVLEESAVTDWNNRTAVLAAAEKANEEANSDGSLSNLYLTGELEAGITGDATYIVIYWAPNANEVDNLYNANNDQTTSDGEPLYIEFGINLQATQKMSESDSFGNDYDEFASILPKATVNDVSALYPTVMATMGIGGTATEIPMDFALQFLPNETLAEAESNGYRYWHADYVISADRDLPINSVALAGYYQAWCQYNNNNWVAMMDEDSTDVLKAGDSIRLVELLGATVNYEEICQYGNDGVGFLCGATALTDAAAGATITVELRLYETTVDPASGTGDKNIETGNYEVVGTYSYTFPAAEVSTMDELKSAVASGAKLIDAKGADLGDFDYDVVFQDGTVVKNAKLSYMYGGGANGTVTFENCEFVSDHSYSCHFDNGNGQIIFNNCTFDGWSSFGTAITNVEMNNCTFQKSYNYGILRFYQTAQLNNCTFEDSFEGIDTNVTGYKVEFTNCTGIDGKIYNNGSNVGTWVVDGTDISDTVTSW